MGGADLSIPPHGSPIEAILCLWGENVDDDEFAGADYFGRVKNYSKRVFVMEQCNSGGFIDDLSAERTAIMTACTDLVSSYGGEENGGYPYDVWCFYLQAALNGALPDGTPVDADSSGDGKTSVEEAFYYFKTKSDPTIQAEQPCMDDQYPADNPNSKMFL